MRSNCTSFCADHTTVDSYRECEHLTMCIRVIPVGVSLMSFSRLSCWCSCHWGQLEEWCGHQSLSWEHGGSAKVRHTCRNSRRESQNAPCPVLEPSVAGSDAAVAVCPYHMNLYGGQECLIMAIWHWWLQSEQEVWPPWWTFSRAGVVCLSCGYAHVLMVSRQGFALSLLRECRCTHSFAWGPWTGLSQDVECYIHTAVGAVKPSHQLVCGDGDRAWKKEGACGGVGEHALHQNGTCLSTEHSVHIVGLFGQCCKVHPSLAIGPAHCWDPALRGLDVGGASWYWSW